MRPTIVMLAVAAATLAAPAAIKPAFSLMLHGSWLTGSVGSDGSRQCMAMAIGEIEGESFIATVAALGVIEFRFTSDRLTLSEGQAVSAELLVDGRTIELAEVTPVTPQAVQLVGAVEGRLEGSILRAIERGERAVVQLAGIRGTFSLGGSQQSIQLLSQCAMNGGRMPDTDAVASATGPDATMAEAGEADAPQGLGNAMRGISAAGAPAVQFQCELTGRDLLGLPSINGRDQPAEALININADGSALINGTTIQPYDRIDEGGALATAAYPAREVVAAIQGAPMERAPVLGLSDEQKEAFAAFQAIGRGMVDQAMDGRPRYMIVSVALSVVGFVDLDAGGNAINQTSPYCQRTR